MPRGLPHRPTAGWVLQQAGDLTGEEAGIVDQHDLLSVRELQALGAQVGGYDGLLHRARLEDLQPGPGADPVRNYAHRSAGDLGAHVGDRAAELDTCDAPEPLTELRGRVTPGDPEP